MGGGSWNSSSSSSLQKNPRSPRSSSSSSSRSIENSPSKNPPGGPSRTRSSHSSPRRPEESYPAAASPHHSCSWWERRTDTLERMAAMVGKLVTNSNKIDEIATYIDYEQRLGEKRGEIDAVIFDLPDLSVDDTLDVGELLAKDSDRLEYFLGLAVEKEGQYVRRLLDKLKIV